MGVLREEFRLHRFTLRHHDARAFYKSQWSRGPVTDLIYVIFRVFVSLYTLGWLTGQIVFNVSPQGGDTRKSMLLFLTIWSYIVLNCHLLLAAIIAVFHYCHDYCCGRTNNANVTQNGSSNATVSYDNASLSVKAAVSDTPIYMENETGSSSNLVNRDIEQSGTDDLSWFHKLSWILFNILIVIAPAITLLYFSVLLPMFVQYFPYDNALFVLSDLHLHAFNTVAILADIFIGGYPVRLFHVTFPFAYGMVYIIFSVIYWSLDPPNNVLYPVLLDWNNPGLTVLLLCGLLFIALPLVQLIFFGLYRLRLFLFTQCCTQPSATNDVI